MSRPESRLRYVTGQGWAGDVTTREELLNELEILAAEHLSEQARSEFWPHEYRERALPFQKMLDATRATWSRIRAGAAAMLELEQLAKRIATGTESNRLRLIIDATRRGGLR